MPAGFLLSFVLTGSGVYLKVINWCEIGKGEDIIVNLKG